MDNNFKDFFIIEIKKDKSLIKVIKEMLFCVEVKVLFLYRLTKFLYDKKVKIIPYILNYILNKHYGIFISVDAKIGKGLQLPHAHGIVIGSGVEIGENCIIYHNVTIGRKAFDLPQYSKIGDNVTIYPGSSIIGDIKVGSNCIIGANSVVIKDVKQDTAVGGNPVRLLKNQKASLL